MGVGVEPLCRCGKWHRSASSTPKFKLKHKKKPKKPLMKIIGRWEIKIRNTKTIEIRNTENTEIRNKGKAVKQHHQWWGATAENFLSSAVSQILLKSQPCVIPSAEEKEGKRGYCLSRKKRKRNLGLLLLPKQEFLCNQSWLIYPILMLKYFPSM